MATFVIITNNLDALLDNMGQKTISAKMTFPNFNGAIKVAIESLIKSYFTCT